jgi:ArsR family transcriptional regulator
MYDSIIYELQADLCRAMGHPVRQKIVHVLFEGPNSVGDIADAIDAGQSVVSRHLSILRRAGIVSSQRQGQEIYYSVSNPKIVEVCNLMRTVLSEQQAEKSASIEKIQQR